MSSNVSVKADRILAVQQANTKEATAQPPMQIVRLSITIIRQYVCAIECCEEQLRDVFESIIPYSAHLHSNALCYHSHCARNAHRRSQTPDGPASFCASQEPLT